MELALYFLISLLAILISCMIFSNAVEWLGAKLNLSHGITGSLLAAVGTALPETIVPLVAIFWGINKETLIKILNGETTQSLASVNSISIGAIIGAPFMLSTVAFFLIGLSSWLYFKTGRRKSKIINMDQTVLERDLIFFLISFSGAFIAVFLTHHIFHVLIAILMILIYLVYLYKTIKEESNNKYKGEELEENLDPFLLSKIFKIKPTLSMIAIQLIISLLLLIYSAHHFVEVIKEVSIKLNFPLFVTSLLLTPIATELPEKFNSWMWIRQKKDTLALGNISGALVFQSTFPITIGLLFTSWHISSFLSYFIFIICIINASLVLIALKTKKLTYKTFLLCGIPYILYLSFVFFR